MECVSEVIGVSQVNKRWYCAIFCGFVNEEVNIHTAATQYRRFFAGGDSLLACHVGAPSCRLSYLQSGRAE